MVQRSSYASMPCSIAQTLEVVGPWWSLLIVRDLARGITRFEDLRRDLGISRKVLTERLGDLEATGVLERRAYSEHPPRHDYVLTPKGRDLFPVLLALQAWGDRHVYGDATPTVLYRHEPCGHDTTGILTCPHCAAPVTPDNTTGRPA